MGQIRAWKNWERKTCRICHTPISEVEDVVFDMGLMAINDFPAVFRPDLLEYTPQVLVACPNCAFVQLKHTVPPDRLFRHFWYRSGVTDTMRAALADIATASVSRCLASVPYPVCDIGSNDCSLFVGYPSAKVSWCLGFDPAKNVKMTNALNGSHPKVIQVQDYFRVAGVPLEDQGTFGVITAISMFYDLDDPNTFISQVARCLHPQGVFTVQMNYLPAMLQSNAVDNIVHEHLGYYTLHAMEKLLARHGVKVFDAELNEVNGGSIRFYITRNLAANETAALKRIRQEETDAGYGHVETLQRYFEQFSHRLERIRNRLFDYLATVHSKQVLLCGASTRGNTTLQYLLRFCTFDEAGERDPQKWKRHTVTGVKIISEEAARKKADIMLVLPWHFKREIIERELAFVRQGGRLVFPLPKPVVVEVDRERNAVEKEL